VVVSGEWQCGAGFRIDGEEDECGRDGVGSGDKRESGTGFLGRGEEDERSHDGGGRGRRASARHGLPGVAGSGRRA